jgi:very-short-patch-repair endonuclease
VIEVNGDTHGTDDAVAHDFERTEYMRSRGIHVLRFSNFEVMSNAEGVHAEIASVLASVSRSSNTPTPVPSPQGGGRPD